VLCLKFDAGTLVVDGIAVGEMSLPGCVWDPRAGRYRAPAVRYAEVVRALHAQKTEYVDEARDYAELEGGARVLPEPRPYQLEALEAWNRARGRGVVVLPTGSGKTQVALMAIDLRKRSTLVIAPTLDLVRQWYDALRRTFAIDVGVVGGGEHRVEKLTVSTYDSAYLYMDRLGARFGLVVFDECHHLPSGAYSSAARASLAPYRLGLTATPERTDGRESDLVELVGPEVYRRDIVELSGKYLADYETQRVLVHLTPAERVEYDEERRLYISFLRMQGISMSSPAGWSDFVKRSSVSADGRRAMSAYRRQREIAFAAAAKLDYLEHLLDEHRDDRTLVFTQDNATAYAIARRFLIPVITHQTKVSERSEILERFRDGVYRAIATSKVLNEGVDVPAANVAVVISGSGSVREHVQRLGRILRPAADKRAILYEIVTDSTGESFTSARRREHDAYR
jgi:superfamily II DNA or RNA helicase